MAADPPGDGGNPPAAGEGGVASSAQAGSMATGAGGTAPPPLPPPIDLDAVTPTPLSNVLTPSFGLEAYNPIQATDNARRNIAYTLIAILACLVLLGFIALFYILSSKHSTKDDYDPLIGVINILFGPIVTLVGSANGFYFGSQSRAAQQPNSPSRGPP